MKNEKILSFILNMRQENHVSAEMLQMNRQTNVHITFGIIWLNYKKKLY